MHLRHKSIPGILFDKALIVELAQHCAYCQCQIAARSIHKHYSEQRQEFLPLANHYKEDIISLSNIGRRGLDVAAFATVSAETFVRRNIG